MIEKKIRAPVGLVVPRFNCDNPLGDHLDKYEVLKHLNGPRFTTIVGLPGSGKTSMALSWLTGKKDARVFRRVFDNVIAVIPRASRNSLRKNIFENHDESKLFNSLTSDSIDDIFAQIQENWQSDETTLLLMDDVTSSLKDSSILDKLSDLIFNRRHYKLSIVLLVQAYMSVPKTIRSMNNNIIVMYTPPKNEMENLMKEVFQSSRDEALDIMNAAFKKKHDFLFINVQSKKMYRNYDIELITNA